MRKNHGFRRSIAHDGAMQPLFDELSSSHAALKDAYLRFNAVTEPELVDACVYEISAAQSRYNYLLRLIKESAGEAAFKAYTNAEDAAWV